jgi:DNA-directed RNA polymerase subunit RPC12/RpoP
MTIESQPMTLREYLADTKYQTWYWLLSACYVVVAMAVFFLLAPRGILDAMLAIPSMVLMFLFCPYLFRLIRCPRCSARLGALGYWAVLAMVQGARYQRARASALQQIERLGKCPNCGLRLDEEIGPAPK